jgi:hypothetical protein
VQPELGCGHMQTERDPEGRSERILEAEEAEADEDGLPDPNRADRDTDRERPDHPPAVVHHVVAANGPDGQRQAGQEPEAKDDRSGGLNDPAEGIQDAERLLRSVCESCAQFARTSRLNGTPCLARLAMPLFIF